MVGLLVFKPNLKLMILTKENVAAQAVAEHMGDHRQTPGGLKKTEEPMQFRQKLMQRPLALRCGTLYVQPHELHTIVSRYLDGPADSPSHILSLLLADSVLPPESQHTTAVTQLWSELLGTTDVWLDTSLCAASLAILWLATCGEGVSSPIAETLDCAAGLSRR